MHYTDIKADSYIEEVAWGSFNNKFYMGVKVKPGTPDDKVAALEIERANVFTRRLINLQLYGNTYDIGTMTTNKSELTGMKYSSKGGFRLVEIPNLPEILKADNDKYVLTVGDGTGFTMPDKLLDKTRI